MKLNLCLISFLSSLNPHKFPLYKSRLSRRRRQAEREERRPHVHPWPLAGRHTGTATEDSEASRGSPETRQHHFPLAKKPVKPLKRRRGTRRRRRSGNGAARHGGKQRLPSPSAASRGVTKEVLCCRRASSGSGSIYFTRCSVYTPQRENTARQASAVCLKTLARVPAEPF